MNRSTPAVRSIVFCGAFALSACAQTDSNIARNERVVNPVATGQTANVPALALARAMAEAGFSRDEILEYGPGVRNALAASGGAQIAEAGQVLALASVIDNRLYMVSRETGTIAVPIMAGNERG